MIRLHGRILPRIQTIYVIETLRLNRIRLYKKSNATIHVFTVNQQDPVVQQLYDEFNCKNTVKYLISLLTVERNMAAFGLA